MKKNNSKLKNFYDQVYHKGEEKHFTNLVTTGNRSEENYAVSKLINWKNKTVLDVGCGTGSLAFTIAKQGGKVLGIDYSKEGINLAKKKYVHSNLSFKNIDANDKIPEKFDVIISIGTLEHMDDPFAMLKKLKRNLKPKGIMILTCPNWTNPRGYVLLTLLHLFELPITLADLHYLTPIEFRKWAKKLGMNLTWQTIDYSWGNGEIMIKDFKKRLPNVLKEIKIPSKNINNLIDWLELHIMENKSPQSGATGLYVLSKK